MASKLPAPTAALVDNAKKPTTPWYQWFWDFAKGPDVTDAYYVNGVQIPTPLSADTTFYVSTAGSDSNPGTSDRPFRTVLGAWQYLQAHVYAAGHKITIQLQNGTYNLDDTPDFGFLVSPISGHQTYSKVRINGDTSTPSNVTIDVRGRSGIGLAGDIQIEVYGIKFVDTAGNGFFLHSEGVGGLIDFNQCEFGSGARIQLFAASCSEIFCTSGSYTISGGAAVHAYAQACAVIDIEASNITITGTPNFTGSFLSAEDCSHIDYSDNTITGAATGSRFGATSEASISATSLTSIPGDAAGTIRGGTFHTPSNFTVYQQLPIAFTSSPFSVSPYEGQLQAFNDSSTATWGAVITGGSTNHVLGYYDGTNWTVAAK